MAQGAAGIFYKISKKCGSVQKNFLLQKYLNKEELSKSCCWDKGKIGNLFYLKGWRMFAGSPILWFAKDYGPKEGIFGRFGYRLR